MSIKQGDFVEITGHKECSLRYVGATGFVESINGDTATVQLVDDRQEPFRPYGEPLPFSLGRLFKLPTPTKVRAKKIKLRRKHLKAKRREK